MEEVFQVAPERTTVVPEFGRGAFGDAAATKRMSIPQPWENWEPHRDLNGYPLRSTTLIKADELFTQRQHREALQLYNRIDAASLSLPEREALTYRIASTSLTVGDPRRALAAISSHYHSRGLAVDQVDARFSLLLAYAYALNRDIAQSLAWFSRAQSVSTSFADMRASAANGTRQVLRTVPPSEFEQLAQIWSGDDFIKQLMAQERQRRTANGFTSQSPTVRVEEAFDTPYSPTDSAPAAQRAAAVGILLPLSGKFAALGRNVKNGLDLALEASALPGGLQSVVRDSAAEGGAVSNAARDLMSTAGVSVVIGDLLSEGALQAAEIARAHRVPLLAFSKKNSFVTGDGVFRLGATPASQAQAVAEALTQTLGLRRVAMIYSTDAASQEFAASFKERIGPTGLELVMDYPFSKDDPNALLGAAQKIEESSAQALVLPDNIQVAVRLLSSLRPSYRDRYAVIGTAVWDDAAQLARSQAVLNGVVFVSPFFAKSPKPIVGKFIEAYRERFKQEPDFLAAQGFDAGTMVAASLKRSFEEGIDVVTALSQIDEYQGLTGKIRLDAAGDAQRRYVMVRFQDGALRELEPAPNEFVVRGDKEITNGEVR